MIASTPQEARHSINRQTIPCESIALCRPTRQPLTAPLVYAGQLAYHFITALAKDG